MSHIPYGYRIENGKAVIDEKAAEQVRTLFDAYLSGDSMNTAAGKAGIKSFHAGIGRMLCSARYLGDGFYPAIIDRRHLYGRRSGARPAGGEARPGPGTQRTEKSGLSHIFLHARGNGEIRRPV